MADLFSAIERLGAQVEASGVAMSLPAVIRGPIARSVVTVSGSVSSQFLSGLLLAAPLVETGLEIEVEGSLVSRPYVDMTIEAMRRFGAKVSEDHNKFAVAGTGYQGCDLDIEPDASSASYFFGAAAALGGTVRVNGLGSSSLQGDLAFVDVLEAMGADVVRAEDFTEVTGRGALHGIEVDMSKLSDTVPTLAVIAALADGPTRISGVGFIRKKESDRIGGVVTELRRCGVDAIEEADGLVINPGGAHGAVVQTYEDHRMAMAFAILGLAVDGVVIEDHSCVDKTFPTYFAVLGELGT
jgi:3-phosphoshikimate 1-carboxyvinyltransferase